MNHHTYTAFSELRVFIPLESEPSRKPEVSATGFGLTPSMADADRCDFAQQPRTGPSSKAHKKPKRATGRGYRTGRWRLNLWRQIECSPRCSQFASLAAYTIMSATAVIVAAVLNPIDMAMTTHADDAGWDTSMLLPHWQLLWLGINGATILGVALVGFSVAQDVVLFRKPRSSTVGL